MKEKDRNNFNLKDREYNEKIWPAMKSLLISTRPFTKKNRHHKKAWDIQSSSPE